MNVELKYSILLTSLLDHKIPKKFKRKTLIDEFKSILQQYPDDGQIFKVNWFYRNESYIP